MDMAALQSMVDRDDRPFDQTRSKGSGVWWCELVYWVDGSWKPTRSAS